VVAIPEAVLVVEVAGVVAGVTACVVTVTVLLALEPQPATAVATAATTSARFTGLRLSRRRFG
jgi:hypothetical protein